MKWTCDLSFVWCGILLAMGAITQSSCNGETNAIFETVIAPASLKNPRNSEGDLYVRKDGSLLAVWSDYYEGRAEDHATARLSATESRDGGRTWGERYTIQEKIGRLNVMSVSLLRVKNQDVLLIFLVRNAPNDLQVYLRRSYDDGMTFGEPIDITRDSGYHVMCNARCIQLRGGRILCPVAWVAQSGENDESYRSAIYYSDDEGHTWNRGPREVTAPKRGAMEPALVELEDGKVLMIFRTQLGEIWCSRSRDGGLQWTEAESFHVASPESPASIVRLPDDPGLLMVWNPTVDVNASHGGKRTPLVAAVSRDSGKTWGPSLTLESDPSKNYAYTGIRFADQRVLFTYSEETIGRMSWKFKSIPLSVLAPASSALPRQDGGSLPK